MKNKNVVLIRFYFILCLIRLMNVTNLFIDFIFIPSTKVPTLKEKYYISLNIFDTK